MQESLEFYNNFVNRLVGDYLNRNRRVETAIVELASFIPVNTSSILDIGCGLGWSSHEFAIHFPQAIVHGIDLSPTLISTARDLFDASNLEFSVFDITKDLPKRKYDVVVMIDVYEHIPIVARKVFHRGLIKVLSRNSRLILACPTKHLQEWLKDNKPEGLQPVDEDIDADVILNIAKDIGGELTHLSYRSIWHSNDYLYAVIESDIKYGLSLDQAMYKAISLESMPSRIERLRKKLNINVDLENAVDTRIGGIIVRLLAKMKRVCKLK